MRRLSLRIGVSVLAMWAALALLAPVLPLRDASAQPDGLVLRNLPPWTRVPTIPMADGSTRYAQQVRLEPNGDRSIRRGDAWTTIPASAIRPGAALDPRALFVLGTDALGRDLLSRLIWGARVSLAAGLLAALVAVTIGGAIGLAAGLSGGVVDAVLMRLTDAALAVPRLFLLLLLAALFRPSLATTVLLVGGTSWMTAARLVRGRALTVGAGDFVAAAYAAGGSPMRVALRHVLPHAASVLAVEAALRLGQSVLLEASLSFLGLGVPPPAASWGGLIADGRDRMLDAWWIATWPGLAIVAVVLAASLVADGARKGL